MVDESAEGVTTNVGSGNSNNKMPSFEEYGTNLTKLIEEVVTVSYFLRDRSWIILT